MSTTRKWFPQSSPVTLLSTELNSLAAGSLVRSSATFNNSQGQTNLDGSTRAFLLASLAAPSAAFAANSTLDLWFIKQVGGTIEDGASGTTPARPPDLSFPLQATANASNVILDIRLPPGTMYALARNNQTSGSQALASSSNTVSLLAYTDQGV